MSVKRHAKVTANYKRHVASGLVGVAATKCGITTYTVDSMYMYVTLYACFPRCLFLRYTYFTTIWKCQQQKEQQLSNCCWCDNRNNNNNLTAVQSKCNNSKRLTIHMSDKAYQNRAAPQIIKVKQDKSVENELETFLSWLRSFYKSWEICQRTSRNVATFSFFLAQLSEHFLSFQSLFEFCLFTFPFMVRHCG